MAFVRAARVAIAVNLAADALVFFLQGHVRHTKGQRHFVRVIDVAQVFGYLHWEMWRTVANIAKPRLVVFGFGGGVDKFHQLIGLVIRLVPLGIIGLARIVKIDRALIVMPAIEAYEMFEPEATFRRDKTGLWSTFQMPFSDVAGAVPVVF